MKWVILKKKLYSEKVLLSSEKLENINDVNKQLYIAKSYFNGDNCFSVNYSKATEFFKLAVENGNSEAQWRYAILCLNSIGDELNIEKVKYYLLESAKQNDVKGKLYYALFLQKYEKESNLVEKLLKECCDIGDIESMYYYAMFLENNETEIKRCIEYYQKSADKGHFDSFIRLIDLLIKEYQKELNEQSNQSLFKELYNKYLPLSVGTLNQLLIEKLIKYYDEKEDYKNSNILIRIGLKLNCHLFGIYYADHLLNAKGMESDIKLAKKIAILSFKDNKNNIKSLLTVLQAYAINNEHKKALGFLLKYKNKINESCREDFHLFYQNFDKKLAHCYFILPCFYYKDFISCHDILMEFYMKKRNILDTNNILLRMGKFDANHFAEAIVGNAYKKGKHYNRIFKTAIQYFILSAKNNCPMGYYYLGKELYYGRFLKKDFEKAVKCFMKSKVVKKKSSQAFLIKTKYYI